MPALTLMNFLTLDKLLHLLEPWFLHKRGSLPGLNEVMPQMGLVRCLLGTL